MLAKFWVDQPLQIQGEVEIPEGYRRVWRGTVLVGDLFLNQRLWKDCKGVEWVEVTSENVDFGCLLDRNAEGFTLVIRKGTESPYKTCPRCEVNYCPTGYVLCSYCIGMQRDQKRNDGK